VPNRMLAVDSLTEAGYAVFESFDADAAIDVLLARAPEIHILFSGIDISGTTTGMALAQIARERWPWIAVILTSENLTPTCDQIHEGVRILPKPYDINHVLTQCQELAGH
jgi:CheY-like chemotaxis protein